MLAGQLYMATDPALLLPTFAPKQYLRAQWDPADAEDRRRTLLTELFESIGEGTVRKPALGCDYGFNIAIGDRTLH